MDNADDLLRGGKKDALLGFPFQPDPKAVGPAVAQLSRAMDLWREVLRELQPMNEARLGSYQMRFHLTQAALTAPLARLAYVRPGTDEQRQEVARVRDKVRELCGELIDTWAGVARRSPQLMSRYTNALFQLGLSNLPRLSNSREAYCSDLNRLIQQWLDVRAVAGPVLSTNRDSDFSSVMGPLLRTNLRFESEAFGLVPSEYAERVQALIEALGRQPHPVVRLYGRIGQVWSRQMRGQLTPDELDAGLEHVRQEARPVLAHPEPWPAIQTRGEAYTALYESVLWTYGRDETGNAEQRYRRAAQLLAVCEIQAERGELVVAPVLPNSQSLAAGPNGRRDQDRLAAVVDRLLEKADAPQGDPSPIDLPSVRSMLQAVRSRISSTSASAPRPGAAARPWQTAQKVFDVGQLPGTFQIQRGLVQEGTFYCVGWGPGVGFGRGGPMPPPGIHGVAVPLDGSKPRQLASVPIARGAATSWSIRPWGRASSWPLCRCPGSPYFRWTARPPGCWARPRDCPPRTSSVSPSWAGRCTPV